MKRAAISLILIALIFTALWAVANRKHLISFPEIVSSYYAKEYCSCRYVVGLSRENCHDMFRSFLNPSKVEEDSSQKIITASGLGKTNQALYIDAKYGCILLDP